MKRHVFMLSDGTGITAEHLGNSLMSQFREITFEKQTLPYIDTPTKAQEVISKINQCIEKTQNPPLVFMTIVNLEISALIQSSQAIVFDLFNTFIEPLEQALKTKSSYTVGQSHGVSNTEFYTHRIEAVEFALNHDDGIRAQGYEKADIILIGVSRSGKTPSCLYMALHFGIMAANFPFTEDILNWHDLPESLKPYKKKLFGLTIHPERLQHIRSERSPGSHYATLDQCRREILELEDLYKRERIPYLDSTKFSIEEIATRILAMTGLKRLI
jgi:[pyruvate, water dikinase]-phosphate phosphotransferase / [pyruvate, water dikinase] kinase